MFRIKLLVRYNNETLKAVGHKYNKSNYRLTQSGGNYFILIPFYFMLNILVSFIHFF
jgi:hypothetical protein